MNQTAQEREWAKAHFREYLLHRLPEADEDRVINAVALTPGLAYDLEDAEEQLIGVWLDRQLPPADQEDFQRYYVNGSERNRAKLKVHRALRSPELRSERPGQERAAAPIPFQRRPVPMWAIGAIAALIPLIILGLMVYDQSRQNAQLREQLAKAKMQPKPVPAPVPPNQPEIARPLPPPQSPQKQSPNVLPGGPTILAAADSGKQIAVAAAPARIVWTPVPDDRGRYRIRVQSPDGRQQISALLTPTDKAIEYASDDLANLPLPWEVTILSPEPDDGHSRTLAPDRELAHYRLAPSRPVRQK